MRRYMRLGSLFLTMLAGLAVWGSALGEEPGAGAASRVAIIARITGVIGPATALYVEKAIERSRSEKAQVLILQLDTPGGLVTSMRDIVKSILASPVPIIGYVSPPGAHAASAGTYILYATDIAAMAPGTNIGAATPVQIGGMPALPEPGHEKPQKEPAGDNRETKKETKPPAVTPDNALAIKSMNDAIAFIRSLAELRGRNAEWAEKAVREAATLNARQALDERVIDLIASDLPELLKKVDGRKVTLGNHDERVLSTSGLAVERFEPDFITKALGVLANPNIALILMMIGVYGLIFEFMSPGLIFPGVFGAISLLLGLYALAELPIDYAGLALLVLGIGLMIAEAFLPTFGVVGLGGLASFIIGAAMLIDTNIPQFQVSWPVIAGAGAASAVFLILVIGYAWSSQARKIQSGSEQLIGSKAVVLDWEGGEGHVWVEGERWTARGEGDFAEGESVKIVKRDGLTLIVKAESLITSRREASGHREKV